MNRARRYRGHALSVCLLIATALALLLWPGRVGRLHVVISASMGFAALAAASRTGTVRLGRAAFIGLAILFPAMAVAGALGWHYRQLLSRARSPWPLLDARALAVDGVDRGDITRLRDAALESYRVRAYRDLRSLPRIPEGDVVRRSDEILESIYRFFEDPPARLPQDLDWTEDPYGDRTWHWRLHTMDFIRPLTLRYLQGGGLCYLRRAEDHVLDWIEDNQLYLIRPASPAAWNDHATALRLRAWLPFWEAWRRSALFEEGKAETILSALIEHAEKLAKPEFYTSSHNHGIEQDVALLAMALTFPELKDSKAWLALAKERLARQVAETVSPGGVHLEHSPGYHIFTLGILAECLDLAARRGVALEPPDLPALVDRMARVAAYLLQPDGRVAPIGDTSADPPVNADHPVLGRFLARDAVLRFAVTRGREGRPGDDAVVFGDAGYAVFRDSWHGPEDYGDAFYLFFTAAAHEGRAHKQADDLSFIIHAGGRDLLVDTGYHSSDGEQPGRRYALEARAHNVVLVDGKGFSGFRTRIESWELGVHHALLVASHDNHEQFRHTRTILYVRPATTFVIDELDPKPGESGVAGSVHEFRQLFHLAPELEAGIEDGGSLLAARLPGEPAPIQVLGLRQLADGRESCEVVRGAKDPLLGWISRSHRTLVPTSVGMFRTTGERATFVTWIEAGEGAALTSRRGADAAAEAVVDPDGVQLTWPGRDSRHTAVIRRNGGSPTASIDPPR